MRLTFVKRQEASGVEYDAVLSGRSSEISYSDVLIGRIEKWTAVHTLFGALPCWRFVPAYEYPKCLDEPIIKVKLRQVKAEVEARLFAALTCGDISRTDEESP